MEWTIGELVERASQALGPAERSNGRVRDVPNERLVRWYATIGLLDPPLARRGRVALYGRRHLLQLIAVKRRQADGRSIAEIQAELTGATDRALETIARLPTDLTADLTAPAASGAAPAAPSFARPRFWAEPPAPPPPGPAAPVVPSPETATPLPPPGPVAPVVPSPGPAA
ncbi:MerR family transcriptional regulator, partial [Planobispora longispora]